MWCLPSWFFFLLSAFSVCIYYNIQIMIPENLCQGDKETSPASWKLSSNKTKNQGDSAALIWIHDLLFWICCCLQKFADFISSNLHKQALISKLLESMCTAGTPCCEEYDSCKHWSAPYIITDYRKLNIVLCVLTPFIIRTKTNPIHISL